MRPLNIAQPKDMKLLKHKTLFNKISNKQK